MEEEKCDNFSDEASNKELLEKAKNEFNREKRLVVKNLPASTSEKRAENVVAKDEEMGIFFKAFLSANCPGSGTESIVGKKKKAIDEIRAFMGFNGEFPIEEVSMIKQNNQAVVTLKDASVVDEAISKLNNTELNGLVVSVVKYHSDKILCVAHLPTLLTEYQFRELAAQYGNLEKCFLMRSEETGESKGYGFVEYNESIETVGKIKCKLDGSDVKGHQVHCDALTDNSQTGIRFQDLHSRCLLINNLPREYKDSIELRELFSTLVKPVYCQIVTKEGESLGFGIIEYNDWKDAEKAYKKFNKHKIKDVEINVSFCIPGKSAVHMFTRIMFKYGDTVQVNKASLLPDPVYPNPAFLKHVLFKTHCEKHPRLLVQFTDNLLHLQEGYVKQLEGRTNTKPGILGPAPSIPMNPLMDVNLQLGLLSLIVLDMREKGTYSGEVPEPLGKVKIPTEEEFQQKAEPVSLLGDPLTAQANIILKNILMPEPKPEPGIEKVTDDKEPKLLGKTVKSLNLLYLCSLGRLMAMLSDRNQSTGILGNMPNVQSNTGGPKPLIEELMQAGKVAQSLLNSMGVGQQNNNNLLGNQDLGNLQGLLLNQNSSNTAAANFMSTIQSLALQKLSESKGNGAQLLNALFGNKGSGSGDGLLGEYQGQGQGSMNQNRSQGGKGPVSLLGNYNNNNSDGQMPFNTNNDDGNNSGYHGNQGNYDDSGYQVGYDNSDFHDVYGGGGGVGRNYGNERGMRGDNPGDMRFGDQMDSQYGNYGNQGQMNMGNRRFDHGNKGTMNNRGPIGEKDYNSIAQQAAAYAAGAAAAYKQQYEEYMAQHGYRVGYGSGYGDDYQSYSSGNSGYGVSDYGGYDYSTSGGYGSDSYGGSNSGSYSTGMSSVSRSSNIGYSSGGNNNMNSSRQSYNTSSSNSRPGTANSYSSGSNYSSTGSTYSSTGSGYSSTGSGYGSTGSGYGSSGNTYSTGSGYGGGNSSYSGSSSSYGNSSSGYGGASSGYSNWGSGYDGLMNRDPRLVSSSSGGSAPGSMGPPMTPGDGKTRFSGSGMNTPQGQKRNSMHILPSPEPSPEGDYIGQHSQGIGGHYADSYVKRQKLAGRF